MIGVSDTALLWLITLWLFLWLCLFNGVDYLLRIILCYLCLGFIVVVCLFVIYGSWFALLVGGWLFLGCW